MKNYIMGSPNKKGFEILLQTKKFKVNVVLDSFTWRRRSFGNGGWSRANRNNSWLRIWWMRVD